MLPYFPCYDGFRLVAYNIIKYLSINHTIHLLSLVETEEELSKLDEIKKYCYRTETILVNQETTRSNFLSRIFTPCSCNNEVRNKLSSILLNNQIDIIYIEGANIGHYADNIPQLPKVFSPHDSSSARAYNFFVNTKISYTKIKYFINYLIAMNYESKILRKFDHCLVVGPTDKKDIQKRISDLEISFVPNGVDSEYYNFLLQNNNEKNIIFTGNMSYYPNIDAAIYFYNSIFPTIKNRIADVKFYIVGSNPPQEIKKLANDKHVIVTGRVNDLRYFIHKSMVYVCPMRIGTGIKNKILEAMSMGIPIVASNASLAGINAKNDEHAFIADDPVDFANMTIDLLMNKEKRHHISINARKLVETEYDWKQQIRHIELILEQVLYRHQVYNTVVEKK